MALLDKVSRRARHQEGKKAWRRVVNIPLLASRTHDFILDLRDSLSHEQFAQFYRLIRPYTMSGNSRLRGLYNAVQHVIGQQVPGDIVECGAAQGGSAALMGLTLKQSGDDRRLWVFDTFEGLPPATADDPDFEIAKLYTGQCRAELSEVTALFKRLDILTNSNLIKGLFQETLPTCDVKSISVLHIDGDWYESVKVCFDHLYDRVSSGGIIQIDDYGHWEGARKAVNEFMRQRSLNLELRRLDYTGRQFIKP